MSADVSVSRGRGAVRIRAITVRGRRWLLAAPHGRLLEIRQSRLDGLPDDVIALREARGDQAAALLADADASGIRRSDRFTLKVGGAP
ncbi:MAG: hypothetical protein OXG39_09975 [Chloroflexi bacterium]|nr:hypothetical protein [Chloroflexota bacterium]